MSLAFHLTLLLSILSLSSCFLEGRNIRLKDTITFSKLQTPSDDDKTPNETPKTISYETAYYDQMPIDHFGYTSTGTFSLKYLYNVKNYKPGGPVFFYTGNEGAIELFAKVTGIMFDLAPNFNAAIVFGEHRYYGNGSSLPFGDDSLKNVSTLNYLTTHQALADYAVLIPVVKKKFNISADAPVIAFGGSYGGMLAAWFRMKYPNIVAGAWASSAPLIQFRHGGIPFDAAAALIQKNFVDSGCKVEAILKGYEAINNLSKTNLPKLNEIFKIDPISVLTNSATAPSQLRTYIEEAFFYLAMTDYPYPTEFLKPLPAWPVEETCKYLNKVSDTVEGSATQIQQAIQVFYGNVSNCVNRAVCGDRSTDSLGVAIKWDFQYCTEITIAMCNSGPPNDFFTSDCNSTNYEEEQKRSCLNILKKVDGFTADFMRFDDIENMYGLGMEGASNIIFTNGQLDPWSAGGVTEKTKGMKDNKKRGLYVYSIGGSGHHLDLRQPNLCDPVSVQAARVQIVSILKCWTGQSQLCDDPSVLQQPLPAFSKVNDKVPKCENNYKGYPWDYSLTDGNNGLRSEIGLMISFMLLFVLAL